MQAPPAGLGRSPSRNRFRRILALQSNIRRLVATNIMIFLTISCPNFVKWFLKVHYLRFKNARIKFDDAQFGPKMNICDFRYISHLVRVPSTSTRYRKQPISALRPHSSDPVEVSSTNLNHLYSPSTRQHKKDSIYNTQEDSSSQLAHSST